jgi:hypothetical protein
MRAPWLVSILAVALTRLAVAQGSAAPAPAPASGDTCFVPGTKEPFPPSLAPGFTLGEAHDFERESTGAGCSVRYLRAGRMVADLYVYTGKLGKVEDVPRDPRVMEEFQSSVGAIVNAQKQLGIKVRDLDARYEKLGLTQPTEVLVATGIIESGGDQLTQLVMWTGRGALWKLRVTYPLSDAELRKLFVEMLVHKAVDLSRSDR